MLIRFPETIGRGSSLLTTPFEGWRKAIIYLRTLKAGKEFFLKEGLSLVRIDHFKGRKYLRRFLNGPTY
jgi:hypothetical protein